MARYDSARSRLRIDNDIRERERHRANEEEIPELRAALSKAAESLEFIRWWLESGPMSKRDRATLHYKALDARDAARRANGTLHEPEE